MGLVSFMDILRISAARNSRCYSSIIIPKRVKRDNLSILKALCSVTKTDYLAPQYQYIDDPYLIPTSNMDKKTFSLSYLSGKNAAKYVVDKYPHLFQHNPAFPNIKAFMPKTDPSLSENSVDGLKERIEMLLAVEAYDSYRKLFDEGIEVPREVMDDLLDLVCFTNHGSLPEPTDPLLAHLQKEIKEIQQPVHWKCNGAAENLFKEIKNPSSRNYCSLIKGMVKFSVHDLAYEEYRKGLEQNIKYDVSTFNAILSCASHVKKNPDECWDLIVEILQTMNVARVAPDVKTFNRALSALMDFRNFDDHAQDRMKATFNEMKKCGIVPNLTTWWHIIQISYPLPYSKSQILYNVAEQLQQKAIIIQEPTDFEFFLYAMDKCFQNVKSLELGVAFNDMVVGSEHLLGDSHNASIYYSHYLTLLSRYANLEKFLAEYNRLVPHAFTPTFKVFFNFLKIVEDFGAYEHLPRIWSDICSVHFNRRNDLIERLLGLMAVSKVTNDTLKKSYCNIISSMLKQYHDDKASNRTVVKTELNGNILNDMLDVLLGCGGADDCWNLLEVWRTDNNLSNIAANETSLELLCQDFIARNDYDKTKVVLQMLINQEWFGIQHLLDKISANAGFEESQKRDLLNKFGGM